MATIELKDLPLSEHVRLYAVLSNVKRIQILFALYHNPQSEDWMVSFTNLRRTLDMNAPSLTHHLRILQEAGLVENPLVREGGTYSQYRLTENGVKIVRKLKDDLTSTRNL